MQYTIVKTSQAQNVVIIQCNIAEFNVITVKGLRKWQRTFHVRRRSVGATPKSVPWRKIRTCYLKIKYDPYVYGSNCAVITEKQGRMAEVFNVSVHHLLLQMTLDAEATNNVILLSLCGWRQLIHNSTRNGHSYMSCNSNSILYVLVVYRQCSNSTECVTAFTLFPVLGRCSVSCLVSCASHVQVTTASSLAKWFSECGVLLH